MSRCLYCGNDLGYGSRARFCTGHHIPYRRALLEAWDRGDHSNDLIYKFKRISGWWDYTNECPTRPAGRNRSNAMVTRTQAPSANAQTFAPLQYNFRKFGIELETVSRSERDLNDAINLANASGLNVRTTGYNHNTVSYWKVLTDASLSGGYCREVVSPPFETEAGFEEIRTITDAFRLMGVSVNNSCGFHVHLDVHDLTPKQIARICKFYQVYETEIDKFQQSSRRGRGAQYCHTLTSYELDVDRINTMSDLQAVFRTRYLKVNIESYLRQGTIEFRHHGGTVDPSKIIYWIKFCTRIVDYAKSDRPIDSNIDLFDALNLSSAERLYWNHRKASFRAA